MIILLYRRNSDRDYAEKARAQIAQDYPDAEVRALNPHGFDGSLVVSDADLVVVRPRYRDVVEAYEALGIPVVHSFESPEDEDPEDIEAARLLARLPVKKLESTVNDITDAGLLRDALDQEKAGQNRKSAIAVYERRLAALGA